MDDAAHQSVAGSVGTGPRPRGSASAVVGLQWGDEGKGKIVDLLARDHNAVVRYNGGANAGHSVVLGGRKHALHLVPSGVFHPAVVGIIANGVVVDPIVLLGEIDRLTEAVGRQPELVLSDRAHVVMPWHKAEDELRESDASAAGMSLGTTQRGIGPAYADKAQRSTAIRVGDLLKPEVLRKKIARIAETKSRFVRPIDSAGVAEQMLHAGDRLRPIVADTAYLLHDLLARGRMLLFEGANATLLDVDHGTYPYVTSSSCTVLGIPAGTGVPGSCVSRVIGVAKAYCTRVGAGPFPTEQNNDVGDRLRERGREYGTTTGRPRRCGWLDLVALRYAAMLNGATGLAVMLLDVLSGFDEIRVCTAYRVGGRTIDRFLPDADALAAVEPVYETVPGWRADISAARSRADLPAEARRYVEMIERAVGVRAEIISVGPEREQTILD